MGEMMTAQLRVLLVDDQPPVLKALQILLELYGISSVTATSPQRAVEIAAGETLGAVIQDMNFTPKQTTGEEGVALFHQLRETDSDLPILLMTAWASLPLAVKLVKQGAADYLEKPWDDDKLITTLHDLLELRTQQVESAEARRNVSRGELASRYDLCGIVYVSAELHRAVELALNVARSDAPVLLTGPSGSGKERIAEIIQANSGRRDKAFIRVNLGAIPEELVAAELFGAEAGAYTGAQQRRIGHFESANGGTLFLDEVDSLSLAGQVKLLRVLQSGELQRLGSSKTHRVDVRIISATNAQLQEAVVQEQFREDLFYRLNVVEIALPELCSRRDDLLPLAEHFLTKHRPPGLVKPQLSQQAKQAIHAHCWPGNVRELENRLQRALVVSHGDMITAEDLGLDESRRQPKRMVTSVSLSEDEHLQRLRILAALDRSNGVVTHAAKELGLSRQALYRKMARLDIELERRPRVTDEG